MNDSEGPLLTIKQGQIQGTIEKNIYGNEKYYAFRGIPYAKPPVDKLRFKDPLPPEGWTGIRDGSVFGNVAPQLDKISGEVIGDDDCLYLNVYTPRIDLSEKLAVMMWIHGGGYTMGSGDDEMFKPDYLIRKNIILVTINFRLGCIGFLNLDDEAATGNQAMKDKIMALRWIRDNIAVFGGDPGNVTIFGGSSGGSVVHYLTMSPMADGLYHKVISQSGVAYATWSFSSKEPKQYGYSLCKLLGCKSTNPKDMVDFLQKVELKKLVKYQNKVSMMQKEKFAIFTVFLPSVDNKSKNPFLPYPMMVAMKRVINVPFMLGFNDKEGAFFTSKGLVAGRVATDLTGCDMEDFLTPRILNILKQNNISVDELKKMYFDGKTTNLQDEPVENLIEFYSDYYFKYFIFDLARTLSYSNRSPTYFYKFSYDSEESSFMKTALNIDTPGAIHGDELNYLFYGILQSTLNMEPHRPGTPSYKVMEIITQLWTDFAKTGNPTPKITDLIPVLWEPMKKHSNTYNYLNINQELRMENVPKGVLRCEWNSMTKNKL